MRIRIEISQAILRVSMIFGKKLVSVPFAPYGGVCAGNEAITDAFVKHKRV